MYSTEGKTIKSILVSLPMMLLSAFLMLGGAPNFADWQALVSFAVTWIFFNLMFFLMLHTGKTDKYRAIVFVTLAILFCANFMSHLVELRGTVTFNSNDILACEIPFCHIVSTMIIIPMAVKGTIIFPGSITGGFASIASMLVLVLGAMLALGRGFCSWGCFYGGWDDGASRILKKPFIKVDPIYTGGNVRELRESADSTSEGMIIAIHDAVFSSLFGSAEFGYAQVDFIPSENGELPSSISETLDIDDDGIDELLVKIDTETGGTILDVCPSKCYTVRNSALVHDKWILRVGMPNPDRGCTTDCSSCSKRK